MIIVIGYFFLGAWEGVSLSWGGYDTVGWLWRRPWCSVNSMRFEDYESLLGWCYDWPDAPKQEEVEEKRQYRQQD